MITYPAELPISARKDDILAAIADHQVVIVAGETGSGKSTQLPKMCLEAGRGRRGLVGHTQPRRLAARAVAERIAEELGTEVGGLVGYAVRFTDRVGEDTLVKLMTDGILLAEIQRDRRLARYDTLIVDEAHERSLNIDFILGYLKQLLPRRPDLKVIVTSATLDTDRLSAHFDGAPVVEVSGRTYPVEVRYRPIEDDADQTQAICDATVELAGAGPGDILVFLSGEREIRDTAEALVAMARPGTEILPLFGRLSAAEQHRVFERHPGRRVVLATNVAETSITVPGVHYVVDPGTARISRYSRRTKVQRLPIEPVSRASANQRAGRCGRIAPGVCIRLYSEEDFASRPEFTEPEILRTNLASVILQMAALELGDVAAFPFVDAPDARNIKDGVTLLEELGALDRSGLTPLGRRLARLPLDPRLGRMVLEADANDCLHEVMVIAAALSIQDPRERPTGKEAAAAEQHARFASGDSDFLAYLRLWDYLQEEQRTRSSSQFRKLCKAEYLNYLRIREWQDIYGQLRQVSRSIGLRTGGGGPVDAGDIHRSLLAGLLSHIGLRGAGPKDDYQGARNARFAISPGSGLFKKAPRWVMAAELVETNRMWARVVARIQPEWAEAVGGHLVERSYSEPEWDASRGTAVALERVTLYGLPIVTARKVDYARVDRAGARELFLLHALVAGEWTWRHAFVSHNQELVEEVRALEDRARRRDLLVDDEVIFDFYDERIPAEITSVRQFDRWWGEEQHRRPDLLHFTPGMLLRPEAAEVGATEFPDTWPEGDLGLALSYEFDPGSETDGVTVHIPLPVLRRVRHFRFDWHIPGLRREVVAALVRSLPKELRRRFVPAGDYVEAFLGRATPGDGPLAEVLAAELARMTGEPVPPDAFEPERLPDHLRVTFRVTDEAGGTLVLGKDLDALERAVQGRIRAAVSEAARALERTGLRTWNCGTLARVVEVRWGGHPVRVYPALVDEGDSVAVRALVTEAEQEEEMWLGTRRLLLMTIPSPVVAARRLLPEETKLTLARSPYGAAGELFDDCVAAAVDQLVADHGGPAWDEAGFDILRTAVAAELVDTVVYVATVVGGVLAVARGVEARLDATSAPQLQEAVADMGAQLSGLVHPGFVTAAGANRLADVLRYLQAMERRLDKLAQGPARDRDLMRRVQALEDSYHDLAAPGTDHIRWMIEELRVSFFAQTLGTAYPISEQRILREMADARGLSGDGRGSGPGRNR